MFCNYNNDDPFNHNNMRNVKNTDKFTYNCGGYALGTFSWYCPLEPDEFDTFDGDETECLQACTDAILSDFPDLFLIDEYDMIYPKYSCRKYEIIAFRISYHDDFHFWKLGRNNMWFDKMGRANWIDHHSYNDVFADTWNGRYDSEIIFFGRKR